MKFFTKSRYALRLMIELAQHPANENVPLKLISERQGISLKYLEQIIVLLMRAGLVRSERGSQGGYRLDVNADTCTAGDILRAIEGDLDPVECLKPSGSFCTRRGDCRAVTFWTGMRDTLKAYADSVTLQSLASDCIAGSVQQGVPAADPRKPASADGHDRRLAKRA